MYRITNNIFEHISLPRRLEDMDGDDLVEFINNNKDVSVPLVYLKEIDPLTGMSKNGDIDTLATIKMLKKSFSFSAYMDTSYWTSTHTKRAEQMQLLRKLKEASEGEVIFELMADMGFGFYNLQPGKSTELDVPARWVSDYLKVQPMAKYLKIEKVEEAEKVLPSVPADVRVPLDSPANVINYESMSVAELQKLAVQRGLPMMGNKIALIKRLTTQDGSQ